MKTKSKVIVLGTTLMLCSMLLLTIPAIAAEGGDYVLDIYGNANEDDAIDMRDLTYVKLIFFGKKPETELADAKYDGKLNPLDFIQIKLIIVGKEKELTIVDSADRIVTVSMPVKRMIPLPVHTAEVIGLLGPEAVDKIVGVSKQMSENIESNVYLPELSELPTVGTWWNPDCEAILSLDPDLVIASSGKAAGLGEKLSGAITVVGLDLYKPKTLVEDMVKFAYVLNEKDKMKHYIDDFHNKHIDIIKTHTEGLSEEEKPKVYVEKPTAYETYTRTSAAQQYVDVCGGRHLFADLKGPSPFVTVDPEEVLVRNPEVIIKYISAAGAGYGVDDSSKAKALRDEIMNRLANVNAVKKERVYVMTVDLRYGPGYPILIAYWAKWIHPDLFEDLDPRAIHQEYLTEFQELDYDLEKHGVFVYPPLE